MEEKEEKESGEVEMGTKFHSFGSPGVTRDLETQIKESNLP